MTDTDPHELAPNTIPPPECGKVDLAETNPFGDAKARIKRHLSAIVEEEHVPDLEWHADAILQIILEELAKRVCSAHHHD